MPRRAWILRIGKSVLDIVVMGTAYCLAFLIRFEGVMPAHVLRDMLFTLPFVLFGKFVWFRVCGVQRLSWRYTSIPEIRRIFIALMLGTTLLGAWRVFHAALPLHHGSIPIGVVLMDLPLSFLCVLALRATVRLYTERRERRPQRARPLTKIPTLLIGAGRMGALVAKEIVAGPNVGSDIIGFLDDDPARWGTLIHGIPVLGPLSRMDEIVARGGARQALITLEYAPGSAVRQITETCKKYGVIPKIMPQLREIVRGQVSLRRIRDVAIEDILRREPVRLDSRAISQIVAGRTILISGAGGSIGSELCREICRFGPAALILVEQAENNLFLIDRQLAQDYPAINVVSCVADICDNQRIRQIFSAYHPSGVFHAAAHKHVPMMEWNPGEAIKNNILGTRNLADMAHAYGADRFVMISTDKAVNPTSVMGVSKRIAEMYIQALSQRSETRFVAVRFGNVLGSTGSVVPIFKEQIARGGPVTITHPEMKRYFMTIPEACQLVVQAASMGSGGEIFILDMGAPVRIVDLAYDLIRLSGLVPDDDIEIRFTGVRPGEKLFEELALDEEGAQKTTHPKIYIGRLKAQDWAVIDRQIEELRQVAGRADVGEIYAKLEEVVPEYRCSRALRNGRPCLSETDPAVPSFIRDRAVPVPAPAR